MSEISERSAAVASRTRSRAPPVPLPPVKVCAAKRQKTLSHLFDVFDPSSPKRRRQLVDKEMKDFGKPQEHETAATVVDVAPPPDQQTQPTPFGGEAAPPSRQPTPLPPIAEEDDAQQAEVDAGSRSEQDLPPPSPPPVHISVSPIMGKQKAKKKTGGGSKKQKGAQKPQSSSTTPPKNTPPVILKNENELFNGDASEAERLDMDLEAESESTVAAKPKPCTHLKTVSADTVKRHLAKVPFGICEKCSSSERGDEDGEQVWACLSCGKQGCGRYTRQRHAVVHHDNSGGHSLAINTATSIVWCYGCDDEVQLNEDSRNNLKQAVAEVQKVIAKNTRNKPSSSPPPSNDRQRRTKNASAVKGIAGLCNLGNTCFFNAATQCLAQTEALGLVLDNHLAIADEPRVLRADRARAAQLCPVTPMSPRDSFSEASSGGLADLHLSLEPPGDLVHALAGLLADIKQADNCASVNPKSLFNLIAKGTPRFRGWQQQDSHELLTTLLGALRTEENRRLQTALRQHFDICQTSRVKIDDQLKATVHAYYEPASRETLVEAVFGGTLLQAIRCLGCGQRSLRFEPFVDLSLPIGPPPAAAKPVPLAVKRAEEGEEVKMKIRDEKTPSKHQLKQMHKQQRKQNKRGRRSSIGSEEKPVENGMDVYDGGEDGKAQVEPEKEPMSDVEKLTAVLDASMSLEDNVVVVAPSQPDDGDGGEVLPDLIADSHASTSTSRLVVYGPDEQAVEDQIDSLSATEGDSGAVDEQRVDVDSADAFTCAAAIEQEPNDVAYTATEAEWPEEGGSVDCAEWSATEKEASPSATDERMEADEDGLEPAAELDVSTQMLAVLDPARLATTGCTVESCLANLCQVEILTGRNQYGCSECTRRLNRKQQTGDELNEEDGGSGSDEEGDSEKETGKLVKSNAHKQYLIYDPPAVLVLQLKRFHKAGYSMRKMNKAVKFPLQLDLAPFCSSDAMRVAADEKRVLYGLYGVVVHQGSMSAGHYVAYVRLCPSVGADVPRPLRFLGAPFPPLAAPAASADAPPGRWFYASDSHVTEVSEERVLAAEAYLLFYERVA